MMKPPILPSPSPATRQFAPRPRPGAALAAALLLTHLFLSPLAAAPASTSSSKADMTKFQLTGDPTSTAGATWSYASKDDGIDYQLTGVLFKPAGKGPFPAVLVSHGMGNSAGSYGANMSKQMVKWGLVCIAPNYSYGAKDHAAGSPGPSDIHNTNLPDNLKRAHKCLDILAGLGYVDMQRVAVHGHSKGAFLTVSFAGEYAGQVRAASHTAGGDMQFNHEYALKITAPYSIHHGDADTSVRIAADETFDKTLTQTKIEHEFHVYPGAGHRAASTNEMMFKRVHDWYAKHGILDKN